MVSVLEAKVSKEPSTGPIQGVNPKANDTPSRKFLKLRLAIWSYFNSLLIK